MIGQTEGSKPPLEKWHLDVLRCFVNGRTCAQAAAELGLSVHGVKHRAKEIFRQLGARDQAHAVGVGFALGLLDKADVEVTEWTPWGW